MRYSTWTVLVTAMLLGTVPAAGKAPVPVATDGDEAVVLRAPAELRDRLAARAALDAPTPVPSTGAKVETVLLDESFEGSWPATPWRVHHSEGGAAANWGRSDHRAAAGRFSIWCAGAGDDAPDDGGLVPPHMASWAVAGPFDLSDAALGSFSFELWLKTEPAYDNVMWLVSLDGEEFRGRARSSNTSGWTTVSTELDQWVKGLQVTGQPLVWIALVYESDRDNQFEGAYVDQVRLVADSGEQVVTGYTYTTDEDFALGEAVGLESSDGALSMSSSWSALPYLWVASPSAGTVSKVHTETSDELARYRTGPAAVELGPSPAVVDLDGSCWVGNRSGGTVVKIGLAERGGCVDRDGNGSIETCTDVDGDGDISADEIMDWGEDECVLFELALAPESQGLHTPGEEHEGYEDIGLQALAIDADNNLWAGAAANQSFAHVDGSSGAILGTVDVAGAETSPFAAVVDGNGALWCSSWPDAWVLKVDPETGELLQVALEHGSRGLALDGDERLFVSGFRDSVLSRIDLGSDEVDLDFNVDFEASGLAVSEDGDLWVAAPSSQVVRRYDADGNVIGFLEFTNFPSAVAVDGAGKIWVAGLGNGVLVRIDPDSGIVDLQKELVDVGYHDGAGDMTGLVARSITTPFGSWNVVYDSEQDDTAWGTIDWTATVEPGSELTVRVRSSGDEVLWSAWESAVNGVALESTPAGRYLEIEVTMKNQSAENAPVLEVLTVTPTLVEEIPEASFSWSPTVPVVGETVSFSDSSTHAPSAWSWSFGDGGTSTVQNPSHVFASAGNYTVTLEASNGAGSDSSSAEVVVQSSSGCVLSCDALVPGSAQPGLAVGFAATLSDTGCSGAPEYAWTFGDGGSANTSAPSHAYAEEGSFDWTLEINQNGASCSLGGTIEVVAPPEECVYSAWIPVVSHADGAEGSVWRADLALLNHGDEELRAHIVLHSPAATRGGTLRLGSRQATELEDVVRWISPGLEDSAALEICASAALTGHARVYNQSVGEGSFGQAFAAVSPSAGLAAGDEGLLVQLRENADFRTNLGFANIGDSGALIQYTLFDAAGTEVDEASFILGAGGWVQHNRPYDGAGRDDIVAGWAEVSVVQGSGVVAYASVVDNATNDGTTVVLQH